MTAERPSPLTGESDGRRWVWAPVLVSIVASLAMGFAFRIIPITPGLDPSFVYAFNYAAAHGLAWGRDFVSTFGPYGFLLSTMDLGHLVAWRIVASLVLALGTGVAVAVYVRSVPGLGSSAGLVMIVVVNYAVSVQAPDYQWFVFFVVVVLIGRFSRGRAGLAAHVVAGGLAGFYLLIKLSLGLGALLTLVVVCLAMRRPRRIVARLGAGLGGAVVVFVISWIVAGGHVQDIRSYLVTGWQVSAGYSSGMSLEADPWWVEPACFLLWLLLAALWVVMRPTRRNRAALAAMLVPLFVAWKHAMVRQDEHTEIFVRFAVFVVAILLAEAWPATRWRGALAAAVLVVPLAAAWGVATARPSYAVTASDLVQSPIAFRGARDLIRLARLPDYRREIADESRAALRQDQMPASMRATIGQASADVYPWDTSYGPANGLSWANRPCPSSFNVYTPTLDRADAAFFASERRPEYLVWHRAFGDGERSIDGRYLPWDEPRTFRAIVDAYEVGAAADTVFLLRRLARPRFTPPRLLGSSTVRWDTWIELPRTDGALLAAVSMDRSLVLSLAAAVWRDDAVYVWVLFNAGRYAVYRVVPASMAGGLWLNPFPITFDELRGLFQEGAGRRALAVRFTSSPLRQRLTPSLRVSWVELAALGPR